MKTREEALSYGLSFPDTYQESPFHDKNWQLIRVKCNKKAFLWTYERNGYINLNVKVDPEWRDFLNTPGRFEPPVRSLRATLPFRPEPSFR